MAHIKFTLLLLCLILCAVVADDVLEFTDDDFHSSVSQHETALVMFYAPWCGHCKRLKPEFEKAASTLRSNDPPVALAKIDCTEAGKSTCGEHSVSGYPTLKIFRNGEFSQEYNGPRDHSGIVKYMRSQVGPSSKELSSVKEAEKFFDSEDVVIVGFFETESSLKKQFSKLSEKLRENFRFGHTSDKSVMDKYEQKGDSIVLYRPKHLHSKFEPSSLTYDGSADSKSMEKWLTANYFGLCGHRTTDNLDRFQTPLITAYYNVDYMKNTKGTNYWRNRVMKVAQNFKDEYNFAIASKDDFQHELNEFGYEYIPGEKPVVCARDALGKKYKMEDEFSMETFENFIVELKDGNLEPYLKSEPVPDNTDAKVKVAVAKNFEELVLKNDNDLLIEFYAPWCGHCKKLAPVFEELGEKMKNEDVDIIKMDATANDVSDPFTVRGFPTLFWVPKGKSNSPEKYEGGRELDDFIKYISKHATNELKGWDRKGKEKKTEL